MTALFLWSKDLGQGIEPGVWYSPFIAYDFNGDGKAEIALKTAPETTKRNEKGRVDSGEEYLSVWDGMTGKEIARVDWPERNGRYGNLVRQNRNQMEWPIWTARLLIYWHVVALTN